MNTLVVDSVFRSLLDHVPVGVDETESALEDVASALQTMTGQVFTITDQPTEDPAIYVVSAQGSGPFPQGDLGNDLQRLIGKPQAFVIHGLPGQSLWIVADGWRGAMHGLYDVLRRLGVRYPAPGERWTQIPSRTDLSLAVHEFRQPWLDTIACQPQFGYRVGGMGPNLQDQQGKDWHRYLRRNGRPIGHATGPRPENQPLGGHAIPAFAAERRAALSNPLNWAVDKNGNRQDPATSFSINTTFHGCGAAGNPHVCTAGETEDPTNYTSPGGVVGELAGWVLAQAQAYQTKRSSAGYDPDARPTFSVEPGDGELPCYCRKCVDMLRNGAYGFPASSPDSSVSDRFFHLANQVASSVAKSLPEVGVNLFAYDTHVDVPSIPLHPNLIISATLGLYADGSLYEVRLRAWAEKAYNDGFELGIYEYLGIPAAQGLDDPRLSLDEFVKRVKLWHQLGLRHAFLETTLSQWAVGLHWYLLLRLAWEPEGDVEGWIAEFFVDAFPDLTESKTVAGIMTRWRTQGYTETAYEFGQLFQSLDASSSERFVTFQVYAHYLRLLHEFRMVSTDTVSTEAAAEALLQHVFRTYSTGAMHAIGIYGAVIGNSLLTKTFRDRWNPNLHAETWLTRNNLTLPTPAELQADATAAILAGQQAFPPIVVSPPTVPADPLDLVPVGPLSTNTDLVFDQYLSGDDKPQDSADYAFYVSTVAASQPGALVLQAHATTPVANLRYTLTSPNGFVRREIVDLTGVTPLAPAVRSFQFRCLGPGLYRLRVDSKTSTVWYRLGYPNHVPLVRLGVFDRTMASYISVPVFFWVPPQTESFAFYSLATPTFAVEGNVRAATQSAAMSTWRMDVALADRGRIWSVAGIAGPHRFLNIPDVWARRADQLLVARALIAPTNGPLNVQAAHESSP